jgi:hypothetical protein
MELTSGGRDGGGKSESREDTSELHVDGCGGLCFKLKR